jgi:hypothetical protein
VLKDLRCVRTWRRAPAWRACCMFFGICYAISSPNAWSEAAPHVSWTSLEKDTWLELRGKGRVELRADDELSGNFLRDILTDQDLTKELVNGVSISGGKLIGSLNLRSVKVTIPLVDIAMEFNTVVDISNSIFDGTLSFKHSALNGGIIATHSRISGSLIFGRYNDNDFIGTRNPGGDHISFISASHVQVDGDIIVSGASIDTNIDLSSSNVKGALIIMYVDSQRGDISATEVGNQLVIFSSNFHQTPAGHDTPATLNFYSSRAQRGLYITRTSVTGVVSAEAAIISGDFDLLGSTISNLDAKSTQVAGYLIVGENAISPTKPTNWPGDSLLDLDGSHLGGIRGPEDESEWPSRILFHASTLGLFYSDFCGRENCGHSAVWFQTWLKHAAYDPPSIEPYKQISDLLAAEGRVQEAQELNVSGHDVERDEAWRRHGWLRYALFWVYGVSVGYGSYPERSLLWISILVGMGALIFRRTPEAKAQHMPYGVAYSFDMLLPIVHLRELHYKIDLNGWERYYFYFHKLMGWALGLLLASVLSGLIK